MQQFDAIRPYYDTEVNEAIQEMILKSASEEQIYDEARKHGFVTMKEDAIAKALDHIIPLEEMNAFGTKYRQPVPIIYRKNYCRAGDGVYYH